MDIDDVGSDVIFALYLAVAGLYLYLILGNGVSSLSLVPFRYPYPAVVSVPASIMNLAIFGPFVFMFVIKTKKWTKVAAVITLVFESIGIGLLYLAGLNTLMQIGIFVVALGVYVGTIILALVAFFGD
jgi:hypothetical protein